MIISRRAVGFMHKSNKYWRLYYDGMVIGQVREADFDIVLVSWYVHYAFLWSCNTIHLTQCLYKLSIRNYSGEHGKQWRRCTICTWVASPRMQKKNRIHKRHTNLNFIQRGEKKPDAWTQKANWHDTQRIVIWQPN